jgi:predicted nuclease of predicted toxin-antitoxin system
MPLPSTLPRRRFLVDENLPAQLVAQLQGEVFGAEHVHDVGLRTRPDSDVFAYARAADASVITQDHDLERDTSQFPPPQPGLVLIELPQNWPRQDKINRILAALRSLTGQPLENTIVIVAPSQVLIRRTA